MKRTLKSIVALIFCIAIIATTMSVALAAPAAVKNAKTSSVTYNSATLTWSQVSGASGYQVAQYVSTTKTWKIVKTLTSKASTTATITGLTTGTSYIFRIRAYQKVLGITSYGAYTANVTAKPLPATVTNFKATGTAYNAVKLTWNAVTGATGYVVQQYIGGKYTNLKAVKTLYHTVTGLNLGTTYTFRVIAYRTVSGKNHYSPAYTAVKGTPKLAAPAGINVTNVTATSMRLNWNAVAGAGGYQVYNYATKKWTSTGTRRYMDITGLKAGTKNAFTVRAYKKVGSTYSYGTNAAWYYGYTSPAAVQGLTATKVEPTSITVSWTAAENARGYQVYLYDYATKAEKRAVVTAATTANVTGLTEGGRYRIRVRAYAKNEAYCYGAFGTPIYLNSAPAITAGAGTTDSIIEVKWSSVYAAASYKLERYDALQYKWTTLIENTKTTSFTDNAASKNKISLYRVTAYSSAGAVLSSYEKEIATKGVSIAKTPYSAKVSWTAPVFSEGKVAKYSVYKVPLEGYSSLQTTIHDFDITNTSATSYSFNLSPDSYHSYIIYAYPESAAATPRSVMVANFTAKSDALVIDTTDASKNAQLLKLVDAINKAKLDKNEVTVKSVSEISMNVSKIAINGDINDIDTSKMDSSELSLFKALSKAFGDDGEISGAELEDLIETINILLPKEDEIPSLNTSESVTETIKFTNGLGTNEENKTVYLKNYIEPSMTANKLAYLYDANNTASWKNGFSSVDTKYYPSNGKYRIVATLKAEAYGTSTNKTEAFYHPGFSSTFEAFNISGGDELNNKYTKLGATTITAYIDTDGKVYSLKIASPFTTTFSASTAADGDLSIDMTMTGNSTITYSFTK